MKKIFGLFVIVVLAAGFSPFCEAVEKLEVRSSAFGEGASLPSDFTCDGVDRSPPIAWSSVPKATQSIVVIVYDPDAPMGHWIHWLIYDLPHSLTQLPESLPAGEAILLEGGFQGRNDFGNIGYGGPCPPSGSHRYVFKVHALDKILHLGPGVTLEPLELAMAGHVLAEGVLTGTYARS